MQPNQKMTGANGLENFLFPLPVLNITQGENGGYSHQGSLAIDFVGTYAQYPYYAPATMRCYYKDGLSGVYWQSVNKVNYIDGTVDYIRILFYHDNGWNNHYVGEVINQGSIIGRTGTAGQVTGDHVHMEVGSGAWDGTYPLYQNSYGVWCLKGGIHIYNGCGVNDTQIINGYGYNWRSFQNKPPVPTGSITLNQESVKVFSSVCKASSNGGVIAYVRITHYYISPSGEQTTLYDASGNPNVASYTSDVDKSTINKSGTFKVTFTFRDNFNQSVTINKEMEVVIPVSSNDIMPLYLLGIIKGKYGGKER